MKSNIKNALDRYCEVKIAHSERKSREIRKQGWQDMKWAVTISVILLLGAFLITQITIFPQILIYLRSSGAGIITWVILRPSHDSTLYEWSPYRQAKLRYLMIHSAQIEIKSRDQDL